MLTRYVRSFDGASLAVTLRGDERALPIIAVSPWATVQSSGVLRGTSNTTEGLAGQRYVLSYDRRGSGGSGHDAADLGLEAQVADLSAVADAHVAAAFDLVAFFDGTPIAIAYAARAPERVRKLVLWHPFVDGADWIPAQRVRGLIDLARTDWPLALRTLATMWGPRQSSENQREFAKGLRERLTPEVFIRSLEATQATNVADEARLVQAETLILASAGAGLPTRFAQGVASLIPGATLQLVDQEATVPDGERIPAIILRFLDGTLAASPSLPQGASGMAVVLFTDIVDSTALTERLGDAAFRERARGLDERLRAIIGERGGTAIDGKLLGDGVLAVFTAASGAIDAALACAASGAEFGLQLHLGIHAGDVIREANNVFGGAVNIASRIAGLSAPDELLVSDIVRGLARTSAAVVFDDRGDHALKGVSDAQRVFAVRKAGA